MTASVWVSDKFNLSHYFQRSLVHALRSQQLHRVDGFMTLPAIQTDALVKLSLPRNYHFSVSYIDLNHAQREQMFAATAHPRADLQYGCQRVQNIVLMPKRADAVRCSKFGWVIRYEVIHGVYICLKFLLL